MKCIELEVTEKGTGYITCKAYVTGEVDLLMTKNAAGETVTEFRMSDNMSRAMARKIRAIYNQYNPGTYIIRFFADHLEVVPVYTYFKGAWIIERFRRIW